MKWTTDQQDRISEAALVACPALDALTPAQVVESAYRECIKRGGRRVKRTRAARAVETPTQIVESSQPVYEWDRPWCNAVICTRVGEWYEKQGVA